MLTIPRQLTMSYSPDVEKMARSEAGKEDASVSVTEVDTNSDGSHPVKLEKQFSCMVHVAEPG